MTEKCLIIIKIILPDKNAGKLLRYRDCEVKTAPLSRCTLGIHLAAVDLDQASGNSEPQTAAASGSAAGLVYPVETLEYIGQVFSRNAFAGIKNAHLNSFALLSSSNGDGIVFGGVSQGILQKVEQHLSNPLGVNVDRWQFIGQVNGYRYSLC